MENRTRVGTGIILGLVLGLGSAVPAYAVLAPNGQDDRVTVAKSDGDTRQTGKPGDATSKRLPKPDDCEQIRAGTSGSVPEAASERDCKRSQMLEGGTGTSSGTGSGKRQPGSGPR